MSSAGSTTRARSAAASQRIKPVQEDVLVDRTKLAVNKESASSQAPLLYPLIFALAATSAVCAAYSFLHTDVSTTAFRSRLPASSLTALAHDSTFPLPKIPYFADKRNFFNQVFVKRGWFWTTFAWGLFVSTSYLSPPAQVNGTIRINHSKELVLLSHVRRWFLATFYWYYLTQSTWFFGVGPSLTQRVLLYSGAECVPSAIESIPGSPLSSGVGEACSSAKGRYYRGGHDVSGHTFMMVHAILFLWETVAPTLPHVVVAFKSLIKSTSNPPQVLDTSTSTAVHSDLPLKVSVYANLALIGLWWWMLAMTSLFFHTPQEKLSGFIFGLGGWWLSSWSLEQTVLAS